MGDLLEVIGLKKQYGRYQAVRDVSLSVAPGEFVALVGPSGCGKTTLLKHIAGFESPTEGQIRIDGQDMTNVPAALRPTSMVFQKLALFPHMTVFENIGFPLKLRNVPKEETKRRVREMIELMQLKPEYLDRFPRQLSGGEQQRVALARSMISSPKLLLLDEPLSALDAKLKKALQAELKRLHRSLGVTFVHVTHDLEEAMTLADRICVMQSGRVLQIGKPSDIYYRPANTFVAGFIGDTNLFPVEVTWRGAAGARLSSTEIQFTDPSISPSMVSASLQAGPALLMVRPELIQLLEDRDTADAMLDVEVTEFFDKGSIVQYRSRSSAGTEVVVELLGSSRKPAAPGDHVRLGWKNHDIFVFSDPAARRERPI